MKPAMHCSQEPDRPTQDANNPFDALVGASEAALAEWLQSAPGQYLQTWQQAQLDEWLPDIFGFHALQLALPGWDAMRASRIGSRWRYSEYAPLPTEVEVCGLQGLKHAAHSSPDIVGSFAALPFAPRSVDMVLCLHALELSPDPHATLREIERILMPEGRLVLTGFNPASLWGLRQRWAQFMRRILGAGLARKIGVGRLFLPDAGEFIAYWRLRDWLRLLGFDILDTRFGCFRLPFLRPQRFAKWAWVEGWVERWFSFFGASYAIMAIKRVPATKLIEAKWRAADRLPAVAPRRAKAGVGRSIPMQADGRDAASN